MRPMPRLFAMLVAILCCGALAAAEGGFWQSPSGWEDPEGKWVEVPLAWDGSTASYAADQSNRAGNGPWLVFDYDQPIRTDRLLVNADFGFGIVDAVHLEARVGGAWTPLYSGAIGNCTDHIVTFPALTTDAIRFRFHYLTGGYYFWLYSFAAFALPAEVLAPQAATVAATSVTASTAALHGVIVSDGGEPCAYRFRYHPVGTAEWIETPWGGAAVSGQGGNSVLLPVVGLQSGVTYAFHIQARNSVGMATGTDSVFTPQPVPLGSTEWLTASDVTAETVGGMSWDVPVQALDDDTATAARCYHPLWAAQWGPYMQLALPEVEIDHVRLSAGANPYIDAVAVEVRATPSGAWTPLYQGAFTDRAWLVCPLPVRATYAQARVRFHVTTTGVGTNWELFEFQVRMPPLVSFAAGADTTLAQPGHVDLPLRLRPATSTLPITVNLAAGGTAQLGTDWQAGGVPGQLVIPAGAPAPSLDVEVLPGSGTGTQTASVTLVGADAGRIVDPVSATVTIVRGDGGGDPGQPPAAPVVTLAITGGLTGEQHATIDGVYTGLTRNTQITVAISAAITDGAALVGTQLVASAGTATQAGATWTLADLPEGQIDLSATATVRKNGQETTGTATQHLTLLVDRTVPSVLLCEPGSTDGSAPLGVGLIADGAAPLLLNQADDASALRTAPGWRCWSVASLAIPARISDPSGLSTVELPTVTVGAAPLTVTPASLDSATTLLTLTDFAGLPESVVPDESLVLGAGAGMQPLHLRVEDRCGNAFDADICSVWKKTTAGGARFGYVPRTTTGFATTIGVIPDNGPTDQAPAQLLATAADIVAVECQGTALRRLSASPTSWTGLGGATPVLWRLSPAIAADALDHLATTVTLRDLAGNRQEVVARATQTWFDAARPTASRQIMADPVTVPQQYAVRILRREMEFPYYAPNSSYAVLKTYLYDAVGEFAQPLVETRWQIRPVGWTLRENPLNGSRIGIEYERGDEASTIVRTSLAGGSGTLAGGLDAGLPQYATSSGHDGSSAISVNPEQDYDWGMMGSGWMEWYTTTPWHAITAPVSEPVYGLADARPVAGAADQPHLTGNLPVMDYQMLTWTNGEEGILASYMSGGMWLQWLQWMRALDRQSWTVAGDLDSVRDHWNSVEGALRCVTLPSSWSTPATVAYPVPATEGRWSGADGSSRVLTTTGDGLDLGLLHADTAGFARVQWLGTGTDGEPRRQQLGYRAIDAVGIPQDVIAIGAGLRCAIDGGFVAGLGTSATVTLPSGSAVTFGDAAARAAAELALRGLDASAFSVWCAGEATRLSGIVRGADSIPAWSARVLLPARGLLAVAKAAVGAPDSIEQALRTADGAAPDQTLFRSAVDLDALTVAAAAAQTAEATWQAKLGTLRTQQSNGTAWAEAMVTAAVAAAGQAATTRATCLAQGQAAWAAYRQAVAAALQPYETELAACVAAMDEAEEQSLAYAATLTPWQLSQFVPTASGSATGWAEVNPEWAYAWFMAGMRRSEIISDPAYQTLLRAKQQADSEPLVSLDRSADPTLCDLYADRTWRDGDLALTGLLRVTGLSLTADAFSAPLRQTLMCELAPETAAVGVYDVLVTCGLVHAYSDELSQQYAGANGAHRMKEALRILGIQWVTPADSSDPNSEKVVIKSLPTSEPRPKVELDSLSPGAVQLSSTSDGVMATVSLSGYVYDPMADCLPRGKVSEGKGDIEHITLRYTGNATATATAAIEGSTSGSAGFWKKNPYRGKFTNVALTFPASEGAHRVVAETSSNVAGFIGYDEVEVFLTKSVIPGQTTGGGGGGGALAINLSFANPPNDLVMDSAVMYYGVRNPLPTDFVVSEYVGEESSLVFHGVDPSVPIAVTVALVGPVTFTDQTDSFEATISYGSVSQVILRFIETGDSSNLFRAVLPLTTGGSTSTTAADTVVWTVKSVSAKPGNRTGNYTPVAIRVAGLMTSDPHSILLNGQSLQLTDEIDGWRYVASEDSAVPGVGSLIYTPEADGDQSYRLVMRGQNAQRIEQNRTYQQGFVLRIDSLGIETMTRRGPTFELKTGAGVSEFAPLESALVSESGISVRISDFDFKARPYTVVLDQGLAGTEDDVPLSGDLDDNGRLNLTVPFAAGSSRYRLTVKAPGGRGVDFLAYRPATDTDPSADIVLSDTNRAGMAALPGGAWPVDEGILLMNIGQGTDDAAVSKKLLQLHLRPVGLVRSVGMVAVRERYLDSASQVAGIVTKSIPKLPSVRLRLTPNWVVVADDVRGETMPQSLANDYSSNDGSFGSNGERSKFYWNLFVTDMLPAKRFLESYKPTERETRKRQSRAAIVEANFGNQAAPDPGWMFLGDRGISPAKLRGRNEPTTADQVQYNGTGDFTNMAIDDGPSEKEWRVSIPPSSSDPLGLETVDGNGPDHGAGVISVGFGSGSTGPNSVSGGFALGPGFDAQVRPFAIRGWTADRMITGFKALSQQQFDDVKVINFSEGIYVGAGVVDTLSDSSQADAFKNAIRLLTIDKGKILVTTSGNDRRAIRSGSVKKYPACWAPERGTRKNITASNLDRCANIVTVGGTARPNVPGGIERAYGRTAFGPEVSLSAPGERVPVWYSSINRVAADEAHGNGTSYAAPFVCGVITQILSIRNDLSPLQVIEIVEATADSVQDQQMDSLRPNWQGYGRVNVWKAFLTAVNGGKLASNHVSSSNGTFSLQVHNGVPSDDLWYGFRLLVKQRGSRLFIGDTQLSDDSSIVNPVMPDRLGSTNPKDIASYLAVAANGSSYVPWGVSALNSVGVDVRYMAQFTMRYGQMNGKLLRVMPPVGNVPIFEISLNPQEMPTIHPDTVAVEFDDYIFTIKEQ